VGLIGRMLGFEGFVDFHELFLALTQQFLLRIFAPDIDELEVVAETFGHLQNLVHDSFKLQASSCKKIKLIRHTAQASSLALEACDLPLRRLLRTRTST
jgi:hypothetical protein